MPSRAYDRRFIRAFLNELEYQNWPLYPQKGWWHALFIADLREPCSSPPKILKPVQTEHRASERDLPDLNLYTNWGLQDQVIKACDRFFAKRFGF